MTQTAGPIALDIPCRRCGYNLRGLDEAGRCPECGTAVGLSTQGDLLHFADPTWLRRLKLGLWLMFLGALCVIVMQLQNFVLPLRVSYLVQPFIYLSFSLITIAGVWLVTAPDPAGLAEEQYMTARKLIRITTIVGLAFRVFYIGANSTSVSPNMRVLLSVLAILFGVVGLVGEMAKFKYLAQLAARIPADGLRRLSRHLMWWSLFVNGPQFAVWVVFAFLNGRTGAFRYFSLFFTLQRFCYLAILIAASVLYVRMANRISDQERIARRSWAAAEGTVVV